MLLLLAASMLFIMCACSRKTSSLVPDDPGADPTQEVQEIPASESPSGPTHQPTAAPTSVPTFEPESDPTPAPTPDPTPEPTPEPLLGELYKGEFSSDTGTALNLVVKWTAVRGSDSTYTVDFEFYLECYTLYVGARKDNTLSVATGGSSTEYKFASDSVDRSESAKGTVKIGEKEIRLTESELAEGAKVEAVWKFKGSYSGTDLPVVTASGEVKGK